MQFSTLVALFTFAFAASSEPDTVDSSALSFALNEADSSVVETEKRGLGLIASKFYWCKALLGHGVCYSCGYTNLGCNNACCRCGATTQISCSTC